MHYNEDWDEYVMDDRISISDEDLLNIYSKYFDSKAAGKLLVKLRRKTRNMNKFIAGPAGALVNALGHLISALENPACPKKYKALVVGAIGYIILPVDIITDSIPGIGWADDLVAASGIVAMVMGYSDFSLQKLDAFIDELEASEE